MKKFILAILCMAGIALLSGCTKDKVSEVEEHEKNEQQVQSENTEAAENKDNQAEYANAAAENKSDIDLANAALIADGKLTVGMVVDYPPFEYYPANGKDAIGIDVDIANSVARELGLNLEIVDVPWDAELFTSMGTKYDVICSAVTVTDERMENMLFSNSYIDNCQAVIVRADSSTSINSFENLSGLRVAVQKDTVSNELVQELIEKGIEIELIEKEVATDAFDLLKDGQADALVCDSVVADGQVARQAGILREAYRDESNMEKFAIAIANDNEDLQIAINEALGRMESSGEIRNILNSWFGR